MFKCFEVISLCLFYIYVILIIFIYDVWFLIYDYPSVLCTKALEAWDCEYNLNGKIFF